MYVDVVFVRCLDSVVTSLTLVKEQRFIRIIYYYYYLFIYLFLCRQSSGGLSAFVLLSLMTKQSFVSSVD